MSLSIFNTKTAVGNLLIANCVVFLAQILLPNLDPLLSMLALYYTDSPFFHIWQPFTYMFLHGSFEHLFFNMFALWMFGRRIEYDLGTRHFMIYYFVCGVGAAILNIMVNWLQLHCGVGASPEQIMYGSTIGASGAVFGLLLAYGVMHPNDVFMLLIPPLPVKAVWLVIGYGVLELVEGLFISDNIAHFAHLGGMLFGYILLRIWKNRNVIFY